MELEPIYKTIGSIVRRRRRRLELPQTTLAARLGISRATLANIETGRQRVLVHHLYGFAEALNMKLSELLPQTANLGSSNDWTQVPMPTDLKPQQKEQIALLIGRMSQTTGKTNQERASKNVKANRRSPR
jgi:transcriptional regulator with XRE-family HTH domain